MLGGDLAILDLRLGGEPELAAFIWLILCLLVFRRSWEGLVVTNCHQSVYFMSAWMKMVHGHSLSRHGYGYGQGKYSRN